MEAVRLIRRNRDGIRLMRGAGILLLAVLLAGCAAQRSHFDSEYERLTLEPGQLTEHGIGFVMPLMMSGKEQDAQTIALIFTRVVKVQRPDVPLVTLPEMLGRINHNDLDDFFREMMEHHRETGYFTRSQLARLGEVAGVRYIARVTLSDYRETTDTRLGVGGLRMVETHRATLRAYMQIWDSTSGELAWEGMEEVQLAHDTISEGEVSLPRAVRMAAERMILTLSNGMVLVAAGEDTDADDAVNDSAMDSFRGR